MASINAFLELAQTSSDPKPRPRASLRRASARPRSDAQRRERVIAVLIVIALEVVMLLVLRVVMQPVAWESRADDRPVLISFVMAPKAHVVARPVVASPRGAVAAAPRTVPRRAPRATTAPAPVRTAATPAPPTPAVQFYSRDGELLLPPAPRTDAPIDLQAHRSMDGQLPGSRDAARADFHVNTDSRTKRTVAFIAQFTGGGSYDPCPTLARDMVNLDNRHLAEMAEEHYEHSCEGH